MSPQYEHRYNNPADTGDTEHEQGRVSSWISSKMPASLAQKWPRSQSQQQSDTHLRPFDRRQDYLTGVRGILVPMAFLWTFLRVFAPAAVKGSANEDGPAYQLGLRK